MADGIISAFKGLIKVQTKHGEKSGTNLAAIPR
jgi:hypothetical protein